MSKLIKKVSSYVEDIRAYEVACFGSSHDKGGRYDPVADVRVFMEGRDVVLTFDGAGFDHFSADCDFPQATAWLNRERLSEISERLGYDMQEANSYTLRFVALSEAQ